MPGWHVPDEHGSCTVVTPEYQVIKHPNFNMYMYLASSNLLRAQNRVILTRAISTRASNILSRLGLSSDGEIHGVYDGQWHGSGEVVASTCPTTGEELARIRTASRSELREALQRAREAYHIFRSECSTRI